MKIFLTDLNCHLYPTPDYNFVDKHRGALEHSGVGMYVQNDIPFKVQDNSIVFIEGEFESIFIEDTYPNNKTLIW